MSFNPLAIPAAIYGSAIAGRNLLYDLRPGLSHRLPVPVICIGNLTTGGTGKTPMTAFLARYFSRQGLHPAIISRGYGRKQAKETRWLGPENPPDDKSPELYGDEALMLHQQLPQIPIVLDGDRIRAARTAIRIFGSDLILMDDGFQHRRLHRDFNLVMIDSQRMFGNRRLLPAGPLREPMSALERADAVIFNKFDARHPRFLAEAAPVFSRVPARRIFCARYSVRNFTCPLN
ncbi:MAG: tetraacyldisaccharide 4'-kinase, partial [Deltaproteobacteria bacterium]|nr:tetraacyldisaccharide 4'-kinase [Deltaproteobacteria bacterium]